MELLVLIGVWAFIALLPAFIAESKGRSFGGFWLYGFILWPVALIHSVIMRAEPGSKKAEDQARFYGRFSKRCPYCAETISADAAVCRYCGRNVSRTANDSLKSLPFEADGVYGGVPYKVLPNGQIEAIMHGQFFRFKTMEQLMAATAGQTVA